MEKSGVAHSWFPSQLVGASFYLGFPSSPTESLSHFLDSKKARGGRRAAGGARGGFHPKPKIGSKISIFRGSGPSGIAGGWGGGGGPRHGAHLKVRHDLAVQI